MHRLTLAAILVALFASNSRADVVLYTETFDDGAAATRFTAPVVDAETGAFDGALDLAFDYGAIGIPAAPSSGGSTVGALMQVNLSDAGPVDEGEGFTISPLAGVTLPENYVLSFDVFFNAEFQSSGTTEYGIFSLHTVGPKAPADEGLNDDVAFPLFGLGDGDGLSWMMDGDAGTGSSDWAIALDPGNTDTGSAQTLGSFDNLLEGIIDGVDTGPGAVGADENWVKIELIKANDLFTFKVGGFALASYLDSAEEFSGGSFAIGYADVFNSVGTPDLPLPPDPNPLDNIPAGDIYPDLAHFLIYDNLVLTEIPEPATGSLVMLGVAAIGMFRRR